MPFILIYIYIHVYIQIQNIHLPAAFKRLYPDGAFALGGKTKLNASAWPFFTHAHIIFKRTKGEVRWRWR
jgi:hypothetical protein